MNYLLDTCVLSELTKKNPDQSVKTWIINRHETSLFISVLVLGEIQKGISKLEPSKKRAELQTWLTHELKQRFAGRILDITEKTSYVWGNIQAKTEKKGQKVPAIDCLIAATAIEHSLIVVTRNTIDIEKTGVEIYNPWSKNE